ncbi:MAG TPA: sigma-70 family RNA polymerase sigma factor [Paenisporosarcina sp.]|nr:sigma-70 family RNA polymerase sigma factor [Paenisporosarcina sp.]
MKYQSQEEVDEFIRVFIKLRNKAKRSKSKTIKQKFAEYQKEIIEKFRYLVISRVGKYRKFSNYNDLEQDGFEALVLALRTYDPDKGSFTWWADKYISTRVSRAANAHSTIRFPLKKARELKPFKTSTIPVLIDNQPNAVFSIEKSETLKHILNAIKELPEEHQRLINLIYGFHGMKPHSIGNALKALSMSRPQCIKILEEAKRQLREKLSQIICDEY